MKLLTLIRHAKSSWKDPDQTDFERPLNKRGERDAPVMGRRLAAAGALPDRILASAAARAKRTAEVLAAEAGLEDALSFEQDLYMASPEELLGAARHQPDTVNHLALVAHNPGITEFANAMAHAGIANVPTCGIVRLELEIESWRDAAPGRARLLDFDYPKKQ